MHIQDTLTVDGPFIKTRKRLKNLILYKSISRSHTDVDEIYDVTFINEFRKISLFRSYILFPRSIDLINPQLGTSHLRFRKKKEFFVCLERGM